MSIGIKIAKPTFDVKSTEPKNLIYSSEYNSIKIKSSVTDGFVKTGAGSEEFSITHNLGYTPGYKAFIKVSNRWYGDVGEDPTSGLQWITYVDQTKAYVFCINGASAVFNVVFYLFVDEGASQASTITEGTFGIKVAQPLFDVNTAKDQDLSLATVFDTFKIVNIYTLTLTGGGTQETTTAHGLDYSPAWEGVVNSPTDFDFGPTVPAPYLLVGQRELHVWSDATNIGARVESTGSEDYTVKVAVFDTPLE